MIFVTVGTQEMQFERLIRAVEEAAEKLNITDEIVVQAGHTSYESNKIRILNYIPFDEFSKYMDDARIIITHGGVGSILNALLLNKKVIAVPRLHKYNEHINDHQLQVVKKMTEAGYILSCIDEKELENKLLEIENFIPNKFESHTDEFIKKFEEELDGILK